MKKKIKNNNQEKYKKIIKIINPKKKYLLKFIENNKKKLLGFYLNNKLIIAGEYTFYGIYQPTTKLWIWTTSIPGINIININKINKIKKMNYLFENNEDMLFYYQLLTNDVLYIEDNNQLDLINDLLLYLSDDLYYFNPVNSMGNIQFLTLVNIKQKLNITH